MKTTMIIENFNYRNRRFTIVLNDGFYCAIEDKYITDGVMNTTLNGLQMCANRKLDGCLNDVKRKVDMEHYEAQGMTKAEAFCKVFNLPNMIEQMEAVFNEAH